MNPTNERILVTGAAGYIGHQVCRKLARTRYVVGTDIRHINADFPFIVSDIRDARLVGILKEHAITHVVHLAAVLGDSGNPERDFDIDVNGTRNVLNACIGAGVRHLVVTSSGAAYGYHADNPEWISENDPLRGNDSYPYSRHKRLVEEMLQEFRLSHPQLKQLVLRPGTVLGANTCNLITHLFERKRILKIRDSDSPFVFIWDQDVIDIIERGVLDEVQGAFNLAGDGALRIQDIARELKKPCVTVPASLIKAALSVGKKLGLTQYGPAQVDFLRYRPVLDNHKLKTEFPYKPQKTSAETFALWREHYQGNPS